MYFKRRLFVRCFGVWGSFTKDVRTRGGGGCTAYADAGGRGEGGLCRCGRPILNHLSSLKSFLKKNHSIFLKPSFHFLKTNYHQLTNLSTFNMIFKKIALQGGGSLSRMRTSTGGGCNPMDMCGHGGGGGQKSRKKLWTSFVNGPLRNNSEQVVQGME